LDSSLPFSNRSLVHSAANKSAVCRGNEPLDLPRLSTWLRHALLTRKPETDPLSGIEERKVHRGTFVANAYRAMAKNSEASFEWSISKDSIA
jgi:hypothetical protein